MYSYIKSPATIVWDLQLQIVSNFTTTVVSNLQLTFDKMSFSSYIRSLSTKRTSLFCYQGQFRIISITCRWNNMTDMQLPFGLCLLGLQEWAVDERSSYSRVQYGIYRYLNLLLFSIRFWRKKVRYQIMLKTISDARARVISVTFASNHALNRTTLKHCFLLFRLGVWVNRIGHNLVLFKVVYP